MNIDIEESVMNIDIDMENYTYYDNVGGYHSPCDCYNPKGHYCGDCTKLSCETCPYRTLERDEDSDFDFNYF